MMWKGMGVTDSQGVDSDNPPDGARTCLIEPSPRYWSLSVRVRVTCLERTIQLRWNIVRCVHLNTLRWFPVSLVCVKTRLRPYQENRYIYQHISVCTGLSRAAKGLRDTLFYYNGLANAWISVVGFKTESS